MPKYPLACGLVLACTGAALADDPKTEARHWQTAAEFERTAKDLAEKGFRITQLNPCVIDKQTRFVPVWDPPSKDAPARAARLDLTAEQYEEAVAEFKEGGFRPVHVCGYTIDGEERFAAVWEPHTDLGWHTKHGLDAKQFEAASADLKRRGFRTSQISEYAVGGKPRYAVLWVRD